METTGKHLVDHWNWAASKGLMNKNTAGAMRAACTQVLAVQEGWENTDISSLDVEKALLQFQNLKKKDFKPKSLEEYKRRFRSAVSSYLSYLADPGAWKASGSERPHRVERKNGDESKPQASGEPTPRFEGTRGALVEYPFPLRDGYTVRLTLPRDLKMAEVKRLNAFMSTLAVDFPQAEG